MKARTTIHVHELATLPDVNVKGITIAWRPSAGDKERRNRHLTTCLPVTYLSRKRMAEPPEARLEHGEEAVHLRVEGAPRKRAVLAVVVARRLPLDPRMQVPPWLPSVGPPQEWHTEGGRGPAFRDLSPAG